MRLFVYGSLKQGEENDRFCRQAHVEPATIRGRLYLQSSGYPMLVIPPAAVLAVGCGDPPADAALEQGWNVSAGPLPPPTAGDWGLIQGELVTFEDVAARLPQLDALESFHPPRACLYHRVLTWTHAPAALTWTYVAPSGVLPPGCTRMADRWPG